MKLEIAGYPSDTINIIKPEERDNILIKDLDFAKMIVKEIGCPLDVLYKALKYGVYVETRNNKLSWFYFDELSHKLENFSLKSFLRSYKKIWWLKEDKSE